MISHIRCHLLGCLILLGVVAFGREVTLTEKWNGFPVGTKFTVLEVYDKTLSCQQGSRFVITIPRRVTDYDGSPRSKMASTEGGDALQSKIDALVMECGHPVDVEILGEVPGGVQIAKEMGLYWKRGEFETTTYYVRIVRPAAFAVFSGYNDPGVRELKMELEGEVNAWWVTHHSYLFGKMNAVCLMTAPNDIYIGKVRRHIRLVRQANVPIERRLTKTYVLQSDYPPNYVEMEKEIVTLQRQASRGRR